MAGMSLYTLEEAEKIIRERDRQHIQDHWRKGLNCVTCKQLVKLWPQSLHSKQGSWLIALCKEYERTGDWVGIKEFNHKTKMLGGDYAKLRYWDLVEQHDNTDEDKRASGLWRPTAKGIQFYRNQITVPKTVATYDGVPRAFIGDNVNIIQVLGKKFSYQELLNA